MEDQLSPQAAYQLERFCNQYLQLDDLDYPEAGNLCNDIFQEKIYSRLFADNNLLYKPPERYQLRVLKELTKRIEEGIVDWDEDVGATSFEFY